MLVTFFLWRQNAWPKKLKEETADFGSQLEKIEFTVVGGTWQKEREAAGHIASVARKRREKDSERDWCSAHFLLSFTHSRTQATE